LTYDDKGAYYCKTTQPPQTSRIINPTPTVIELVYFKAKNVGNHILLEWKTASEIDNAGFHTWRKEKKDAEYTRITEFIIPAEGGATWGAKYSYKDVKVTPGKTYYYKLEDIDNSGASAFHGPVQVTPSRDRLKKK
jgi:hypothetical protein